MTLPSPALGPITEVMAGLDLRSVALADDHPAQEAISRSSDLLNAGGLMPRAGAALECTTITQVIEVIPSEYREELRRPLLELGDDANKYESLRMQVSRLESNVAAARLGPEFKGIKPPKVQVSKGAAPNTEAEVAALIAGTRTYALSCQSQALAIKKAELEYYSGRLDHKFYLPGLLDKVHSIFLALKERSVVTAVTVDADDMAPTLHEAAAEFVPHHLRAQYNSLCHELPTICIKIVNLTRARLFAQKAKKERKQEIRERAVAAAPDLAGNGKTIAQLVQAEVAKRLKNKGAGKKNPKKKQQKKAAEKAAQKGKKKKGGKSSKPSKGSGSGGKKPKKSKK